MIVNSLSTARDGVRPPRARGVIIRPLFRIVVVVSAVLLLSQAVLAGLSLEGDRNALDLHMLVGTAFLGVAIVQDVLAILWWKPGGGAGWLPIVAVLSHVLGLLQMEAGHAGLFALHLPMGLTLVLFAAALVVGAFSPLGRRRRTGHRRGSAAVATS
ncbi:hypothetical protein [Nesterenkonia ebinurensis]|uniref:hypothetical protein n=1 Tax=Nesterenkonia ebinurensis TaxID=2608252 RepID=UPI00123D4AE7|nr:hypothetical protein [Nesterenkonia ebinurensis]